MRNSDKVCVVDELSSCCYEETRIIEQSILWSAIHSRPLVVRWGVKTVLFGRQGVLLNITAIEPFLPNGSSASADIIPYQR